MNISLTRKFYEPDCVIGTIIADTLPFFTCYTLEDKPRTSKIQNQTAIPAGEYSVTIDFSTHFNRDMPLINNVPGYDGVRIHKGNTSADTDGCILVGQFMGNGNIYNCEVVFETLFATIQSAINGGETVMLKIIDTYAPIEALSAPTYFKSPA